MLMISFTAFFACIPAHATGVSLSTHSPRESWIIFSQKLHHDSGAWLLRAGMGSHSTDLPTPEVINHSNRFQDFDREPIIYEGEHLRYGAVLCLSQPQSSLAIRDMYLDIHFCVSAQANTFAWFCFGSPLMIVVVDIGWFSVALAA